MLLLFKNLLFTVIVPGTVAVYVPLLIAGGRPAATGALLASSFVLLIAGASIYAWCVWDFAVTGRGTPVPFDAPKTLVVRGLFRYTRNPMYVGVLLTVFGWSARFGSLRLVVYGVVVAICFHLVVLLYEEPHLRHLFGADYDSYRAKVGRWLPKIQRPTDR